MIFFLLLAAMLPQQILIAFGKRRQIAILEKTHRS